MLPSKSKWNFLKIHEQDNFNGTDETLNMSPFLINLLMQRGVMTIEEAKKFLNPVIRDLHNPVQLHSIEKASERIVKAIENGEKILVYGDYDADGVTSTTVMIEALRELGANCDFYIPNRFSEGYGPNEQAFQLAHEQGVSVIITVDNGIAAMQEAAVAKELGIDLIITDHHEVQDAIPDAFSIIHPKCSENYPFKELAGVGVAFKLAQYILGYFPEDLLDLVAIGTIADMVPLLDENRVLAFYGLQRLTTTRRPGLKALIKSCKIEGNVTEEDVGFLIGPRLNAVGRLQDATLAVELLLTDDEMEAEVIAEEIEQLNQERRNIVEKIVKEAEQSVDANDLPGVIVVAKPGWNQGVLGIVASRLVKKFDRPAIVLTIDETTNIAKGSARSIPAFDLFTNCMEIKSLFTHFGGHAQAAGMTLPIENISTIQKKLHTLITSQLDSEDFKQQITISQTLAIADINAEMIEDTRKLAPFGMANPKPVFHIRHIPSDIRQLGNMKKHLKMQFQDDGVQIEGIGFGWGNQYDDMTDKVPVSIVGELGFNEWNGMKKIQMMIQDINIDQWQLFDFRGKRNATLENYIKSSPSVMLTSAHSLKQRKLPKVTYLTYEEDMPAQIVGESLFILELPPTLQKLQHIVTLLQPKRIYVCFYVENSTFLSAFPSRNDFKWYYAVLVKERKLQVNYHLNKIMQTKKWSKEKIVFMSKVFFELEFVNIENGVIELNPNPIKKDLTESRLYQNRVRQAEIEQILYYSTYDELYQWFSKCLDYDKEDTPKEEVNDGLQTIY